MERCSSWHQKEFHECPCFPIAHPPRSHTFFSMLPTARAFQRSITARAEIEGIHKFSLKCHSATFQIAIWLFEQVVLYELMFTLLINIIMCIFYTLMNCMHFTAFNEGRKRRQWITLLGRREGVNQGRRRAVVRERFSWGTLNGWGKNQGMDRNLRQRGTQWDISASESAARFTTLGIPECTNALAQRHCFLTTTSRASAFEGLHMVELA